MLEGAWSWERSTGGPSWSGHLVFLQPHLPTGLEGGGGLEGDAPQLGEHRPAHLTSQLDRPMRHLTQLTHPSSPLDLNFQRSEIYLQRIVFLVILSMTPHIFKTSQELRN